MTDLSDPQMGEYGEGIILDPTPPANIKETWFHGVWHITRAGEPLPLWTRFWAKVFFGYTWERI
jgi:hypothetical protein